MDKKVQFTQARIRALPTPEKGRVDYHDLKVPKLTCRVSHTGNKSFVVLKWNGKTMQRVTVGKFPDVTVLEAQQKAQAILTEINSGIDPIAQKRKQVMIRASLVDIFEQYLSDRKLKLVTINGYRYNMKKHFNDWLDKPASSISEAMVLKRHKELSIKGETTANSAMRVLRLTLNYAHAIGAVDDVSTKIISKTRLWHKNRRKERVIPSNKLKQWYESVEALSNYKAKVYLLMLLHMGLRSSETLSLEWRNVSLKSATITLLDTKNGTDLTLPIPAILLPYIRRLHRQTSKSKWVFASDNMAKPITLPKKPIATVIKASGVEFSPHDCRRTFATIAEAVNLPLTMIKRLMNHVTSNDVTGGYIITEEETLRQAINKVADYINTRVNQQGNVFQISGVIND